MTRAFLLLTTLTLALAVAAPTVSAQLFLNEDFNDNSAGWTMTGDWMIGPAAPSGTSVSCGNPDPSADAAGTAGGGLAGTDIGGYLSGAQGASAILTSPVFDTSCVNGSLKLSFMRHLNADYLNFMDNFVEVFDGFGWVRIATYGTNGSTQVLDSTWVYQEFDLGPYVNAQLRIRFGSDVLQAGAYTDCSGWNLDNIRLEGGIFVDTFANNDAGWTLDGAWGIGGATPSSGHWAGSYPDPAHDASRTLAGGIAGVAIGGNQPSVIVPFQYFTSPVINTLGTSNPRLTFDRKLNSDHLPYQQQVLEVFDGTNWVQLFQFGTQSGFFTDSGWVRPGYDLTPYSNANLRVRFGYRCNQTTSLTFSGWNIDNLVIYDDVGAVGQASSVGAVLDVNNSSVSPLGHSPYSFDCGPYVASVPTDTMMAVQSEGAPNQPWVLLLGDLNVGANPIPGFGQLDIGNANFQNITLIGSGLDPGFPNAFFHLDSVGHGGVSFFLPSFLSGAVFTLQAIMYDPAVPITVSNAVEVQMQ